MSTTWHKWVRCGMATHDRGLIRQAYTCLPSDESSEAASSHHQIVKSALDALLAGNAEASDKIGQRHASHLIEAGLTGISWFSHGNLLNRKVIRKTWTVFMGLGAIFNPDNGF